MTVSENLAMGAYRVGSPSEAIRERILARFPRLRERLNQRAGLMSGGEQQMLAIGRALMSDPEILLLDEPSMGLAPLVVDEIFAAIAEFRAEGRTVLLVEQNAGAALDVADYAYVLESGRVELHGPGRDIARNPAVVKAYLGF
jgi:branched-chain amino acid transport system ATP-binding protein